MSKDREKNHKQPSKQELQGFVDCVNDILKDDPDVSDILPIEEPESIYAVLSNGVLLCKLINASKKAIIKPNRISTKPKNKMEMIQNLNLGIEAARKIGCQVTNVSAEDFVDCKEYLVAGVFQQVVKHVLISMCNFGSCPEMLLLSDPSESLVELMETPSEAILLRWMNFHLRAGGHMEAKNLTSTTKDGACVSNFVSTLYANDIENLEELTALAGLRLWNKLLEKVKEIIDIPSFILADELSKGNALTTGCFLSVLFNNKHGLKVYQPEDVANFTSEIAELKAELAKRDKTTQTSTAKISDLEHKITRSNWEIEQLKEAARLRDEEDNNTLEGEELSRHEKLVNDLKMKIDELENTSRSHKITAQALKNNMKAQDNELTKLRTEKEQLKQELNDRDALKQEISLLKEKEEELREMYKIKRDLESQIAKLNKQIERQKEDISCLGTQELRDVRDSLHRANDRCSDLQKEVNRLSYTTTSLTGSGKTSPIHPSQQQQQHQQHQKQVQQRLEQQQPLSGMEGVVREDGSPKMDLVDFEDEENQTTDKNDFQDTAIRSPMEARKLDSFRRQLKNLYHSSVTRKIVSQIYPDLSVAGLENTPAQKSGIIFRHLPNSKEPKQAMYFVLVDNFFFSYKLNKKDSPADSFRIDNWDIQRMTIPDQYILNMIETRVLNPKDKPQMLTIECKSETDQLDWYNALLRASSWWDESAEDQTANRIEMERRQTVANQIKFKTMSMEDARSIRSLKKSNSRNSILSTNSSS